MPHKRAKKSLRETATQQRGYDNAPVATDMGPNPLASTSSATAAEPSLPTAPIVLGVGVLAPSDEKKKKKARVLPKDRVNAFGGRNDMGGMSKSAYRILNAGSVREEYHANKKRKLEEVEAAAAKGKKGKKPLEMLPYESLASFNRRVEVALRPSIDSAIRGAKLSSAKGKREKVQLKKDRAAALAAAATAKADAAEEAAGGAPKEKKKAPVDPFVPPVKERPAREFEVASQRRNIGDVAMAPPTLKKARRGIEAGPSAHDTMPTGRMPVSDGLKKIMELEREKAVSMYRAMKEKRDSAQLAAQA
ncbi:hypothetical protein RQP46_001275 [Phenoliferia psychrophenolica]